MFYITIDLETTANGPEGDPGAEWKENRVLLFGHKENPHNVCIEEDGTRLLSVLEHLSESNEETVLIGHALKFDIKWLMREGKERGFKINWKSPFFTYRDIQYNRYRASGHQAKFATLEEVSIGYTKKLDLDALLASGVKMEDIPLEDLTEYLIDDLEYTWSSYSRSIEAHSYQHLPALCEMELQGLYIDKGKLLEKSKEASTLIVKGEEYFFDWCNEYLINELGKRPSQYKNFKYTANRTISYLLTGHPSEGISYGPRTFKFDSSFPPLLDEETIEKVWGEEEPTNLGHTMDDDHLNLLQGDPVIDFIREYRDAQKHQGTYYGPTLETLKVSDTIHPSIHTVSTNTGRTSSANPNGQNMPPAMRECIKAREEDHNIYEIDFKQLEMVAAAHLSRDEQLIDDLNNGRDVHFETGRTVMGWGSPLDQTEATRRVVKGVNFGILYGGGAAGIAKDTGQDIELVKDLIGSFYSRYPRIKEWQEEVYKEVCATPVPFDLKDGEQRYCSYWKPPKRGEEEPRKYCFVETDSPTWLRKKTGRKFSFKPTHTKNYPVQGFAGGDIVMKFIELLWRMLIDSKMILTVHDSVLLESPSSRRTITHMTEAACTGVENFFNLPVKLEFKIKCNTHWS